MKSNFKTMLSISFLTICILPFQNCTPATHTELSSSNSTALVINGKTLYSQSCSQCHSEINSTTKQGKTWQEIRDALNNESAMLNISLTDDQVKAIAQALVDPLPIPKNFPTLPLSSVRVGVNTAGLNRVDAFGSASLRRLTRLELKNSVRDLFGKDPGSAIDLLPADQSLDNANPFNNDANLQNISLTTIEKYENFAINYANSFLSNTAAIDSIAGCTPTSSTYVSCFNSFASKVARLAFHRPITSTDLTRYNTFAELGAAAGNFYLANSLFIQFVVQHPEFLYRVEGGQTIAGTTLRQIDNYEIAARLSYLIWGSVPDSQLMDAADLGLLNQELERKSQATRMLNDPRAKLQWQNFHAQWLGYDDVILPAALAADMKQETNKLIDLIGFETSAKWLSLFSHTQTYLTPDLSNHYQLGSLTSPGWINYQNNRGGGILSHAQYLAQGSKFGDTSPTLRGYRVLKRIFCQKFGPIPAGIDPTVPPAGAPGSCKTSTYNMRYNASCVGCHALTDNIGFGLENFNPEGQWRTTEPGKAACNISGNGALGIDLFSGPANLGNLISENPVAEQCLARQLLRFSLGRGDTPNDQTTIEALHAQYLQTPQLKSMILAIVQSPAFTFR